MSSTGSVSDSSDASSNSDSSDASSNDSDSAILNLHLIDAIETGNLVIIREILSQEDKGGRAAVTDDLIHDSLSAAAQEGSVGACRLLWGKLSRRGKQMYFATTISSFQGPLHVAVMYGHLEVMRLFVKEFKWNINQKDYRDKTPLCYAALHHRLEIVRYLLGNGANVNQGGKYGPLWFAVRNNNTEVCRLLLVLVEYQANPNNLNRRPADEEDANNNLRITDLAIIHGYAVILRMLLEHGAFVGGHYLLQNETSLNMLLSNQQKSLETILTICRILIAHAREDHATAAFMQASFEFAVNKQTDNDNAVDNSDSEDEEEEEAPAAAAVEPAVDETCQILLDAGIDRRMCMYCAIQAENLSICQLLVREYGVDPFLQQEQEDDDSNETAASPFLAAARQPVTSIFEYFLDHWDERFSSTNGGNNSDGDYPLHVVCCDPRVSFQAIQLLVTRHAEALATVDGEEGLLPFHFAANWGASLDVIFYLLQHCPDALSHVGNASSSATTVRHCLPDVGRSGSANGMIESNSDDNKQHVQSDLNATGPAPTKAKTAHSI